MNAVTTAEEGIPATIEGEPLKGRHVLIVVENLPLPFDRRVWQEARTLKAAGAHVSIICPTGKGYEARFEVIEGIDIHRHPLPLEAKGAIGFLAEYGAALFWETVLAWKIYMKRRIDVIQGCNPPDLIFLVALPFKLFGVRYIFDHHDINPELYEAKFNKRGFFWQLMVLFEKLTFMAADVSIATNHSYRTIAIERGGMAPERVHVVRSGPDLSKLKRVDPVEHWKNGRAHMVGYVGVMGEQEGIDLLIDAVEHIVRQMHRDDIQFVLVGGGPALNDLKALTAQRGLAVHITFTGRAPDADLFEVLSTMDLGVNPDRVNAMNDKSTMNKIMEYMSSINYGLPTAQSDHAGLCGAGAVAAGPSGERSRTGTAGMIARVIWFGSLALIAGLTLFLQLDKQSETTPALAAAVPAPLRDFAQTRVTLAALEADDPAAALAEAKMLVQRRPVPAEYLSLLAIAQARAGQADQAALTIQMAGKRGWREPLAQEAVLRLALAAGDTPEAARRYAALFLLPTTPDKLLENFGPQVFGEQSGLGRATMIDIVTGGERWHSLFLRRGLAVMPADAFGEIAAASMERGAAFDCGVLDRAIIGLRPRDAAAAARLERAAAKACG